MQFLLERPASGLLLDPGLGKTSVTLAAFSILQEQGIVKRMLVVAPIRPMISVWPVEARIWRDFAHLKVTVLHGPKKDALLHEPADVYVINPEGLKWLATYSRRTWKLWPEMLVVDESTKFKHARTKRFRLLRKMLPRFHRRHILTGSPAPNGLLDLFGQIWILDFGEALGRYITHFRDRYFTPTGFGGFNWVLRSGSEAQIYGRLKPLVKRLDASDYVKLPPKIVTTIGVELPKTVLDEYAKLEQDFILQLREGTVSAQNVGVLTSKLRQAANGAMYLDRGAFDEKLSNDHGKERRFGVMHHEKLTALVDLLEELSGQPTLVAYQFRHDLERLCTALAWLYDDDPSLVPWIGGGVSLKLGKEREDAWNRGELPALLVHPASISHGVNLQRGGAHLAWFGMTYDLDHYEQLIRRLWRQGQKRRVFVYHLVAKRTIETKILTAIERKAKTQNELLDALKSEYLAVEPGRLSTTSATERTTPSSRGRSGRRTARPARSQ